MTTEPAGKTCTPCRGAFGPMTANEANQYVEQTPDWALDSTGTRIERTFEFTNFREGARLRGPDRRAAAPRQDDIKRGGPASATRCDAEAKAEYRNLAPGGTLDGWRRVSAYGGEAASQP
jgi:hypothetical protein